MVNEYVQVTPVLPAVGGVLSVATVVPTSGHALMGAEYLTDACAEGGEFDQMCQVDPTIGQCV